MSNAMRSGKRLLAGVAAGALAVGLVPVAVVATATSASAVTEVAASVAPVRYSTSTFGSTTYDDTVWGAPVVIGVSDDTAASSYGNITLDVTEAPSSLATISIRSSGGIITNATDDSTATLTSDAVLAKGQSGGGYRLSADDSVAYFYIGVNQAGTYAGTMTIVGDAAVEYTWSFTTAGKPTAMTLSPTSVSLAAGVSDYKTVGVVLTDAAGKYTQPAFDDTINLTVPSAGSGIASTNPSLLNAASFDDSDASVLGVGGFAIIGGSTAGTTTVTASPAGTLPSTGVSSKAVAVTVTSQATNPPTSLVLSAPTSQVYDDTITDDTRGYVVNANLVASSTITGAGASANAPVAVTVTNSGLTGLVVGGTTLGSSGGTVIATTNASGAFTLSATWTAGSNTAGDRLTFTTGSGSSTRWVIIDIAAPANASKSVPSGTIVEKVGDATSFAITLTDSFGNPYSNYIVTGKATSTGVSPAVAGSTSAAGVTDAAGKAVISVPAPSATYAGAASIAFTVLLPSGGSQSVVSVASVTVTYTATGEVTTLTMTSDDTEASVAWTGTPYTSSSYYVPLVVTSSPADSMTLTAPSGVYFITADDSTAGDWKSYLSGSEKELTFTAVATGTTVYAYSTKAQTVTVTVAGGGKTASLANVEFVQETAAAAYNVKLTPATPVLLPKSTQQFEVLVTDVFDNPIVNASGLTIAAQVASGGGVLGGGSNTQSLVGTNAAGKATFTYTAPAEQGEATVAIAGTGSQFAAVANPVLKFPAPTAKASAKVTISGSASDKSILIVGERGTVSGKPGILVDGSTVGLIAGAKVKPWVRFPGETAYAVGTARPTVSALGDFSWQRKTGKKTYVYFTTEDDAVKSNRVIIAAN